MWFCAKNWENETYDETIKFQIGTCQQFLYFLSHIFQQ